MEIRLHPFNNHKFPLTLQLSSSASSVSSDNAANPADNNHDDQRNCFFYLAD